MSNETGSTLFITLLAAYMVLLYRYTNQNEILVGTPATGRARSEFAGVVGYFINAVVIRADFSEELTFKQFIDRMKKIVFEALEHQDYPYSLLVEKLNLKYDPSRLQLLQVMFLFIDDIRKAQKNAGNIVEDVKDVPLKLDSFEIPTEEGQNDMIMVITKMGDKYHGVIRYDRDLYKEETISRIADSFLVLLDNIAANPGEDISRLAVLPENERSKIMNEWNRTEKKIPRGVPLS